MRMLKQMSRHTRKDKFWNDCIKEKVGIAPIEKKMTETKLRWFEYVQRRPLEAPIKKVDQMDFNPMKKGKGRPKRTLGEVIKNGI